MGFVGGWVRSVLLLVDGRVIVMCLLVKVEIEAYVVVDRQGSDRVVRTVT